MQDFRVQDVRYFEGEASVFPAYRFWISAGDLARFGYVFASEGAGQGAQIIPRQWVHDSVVKYSTLDTIGYGYLWWVMADGQYKATGTGGQKVWIHPRYDLVMINRVDTGEDFSRALWFALGPRVSNTHMRKPEGMLLGAAPD